MHLCSQSASAVCHTCPLCQAPELSASPNAHPHGPAPYHLPCPHSGGATDTQTPRYLTSPTWHSAFLPQSGQTCVFCLYSQDPPYKVFLSVLEVPHWGNLVRCGHAAGPGLVDPHCLAAWHLPSYCGPLIYCPEPCYQFRSCPLCQSKDPPLEALPSTITIPGSHFA